MKNKYFGQFLWTRFVAIIYKEFVQMRRDRITFAMMIGIPIMQLVLFGYAINTNPKHLPTAIVAADQSIFTNTFINGLINTDYFRITRYPKTKAAADKLLAEGKVLFVVQIPPSFSRDFVRDERARTISSRPLIGGYRPQILVEADATDPVAVGNALGALPTLVATVFNPVIKGTLHYLKVPKPPIDLVVHERYNPERITAYNIVPGLLGVVLTLTMVIITSMAMTRERERGTLENLLATPAKPLEVMLGKIIPYIIVGYIQVSLILIAAYVLFQVPIEGSLILLLLCALPFIVANLSVGLMFSSMSETQLQASQLAIFFFLPSLLLSGFMFPFYGMPIWAQYIGNIFPLTYFLRIVRGIMLKGNDLILIWPNLWPIFIFIAIVVTLGVKSYRRTLD